MNITPGIKAGYGGPPHGAIGSCGQLAFLTNEKCSEKCNKCSL